MKNETSILMIISYVIYTYMLRTYLHPWPPLPQNVWRQMCLVVNLEIRHDREKVRQNHHGIEIGETLVLSKHGRNACIKSCLTTLP